MSTLLEHFFGGASTVRLANDFALPVNGSEVLPAWNCAIVKGKEAL